MTLPLVQVRAMKDASCARSTSQSTLVVHPVGHMLPVKWRFQQKCCKPRLCCSSDAVLLKIGPLFIHILLEFSPVLVYQPAQMPGR